MRKDVYLIWGRNGAVREDPTNTGCLIEKRTRSTIERLLPKSLRLAIPGVSIHRGWNTAAQRRCAAEFNHASGSTSKLSSAMCSLCNAQQASDLTQFHRVLSRLHKQCRLPKVWCANLCASESKTVVSKTETALFYSMRFRIVCAASLGYQSPAEGWAFEANVQNAAQAFTCGEF